MQCSIERNVPFGRLRFLVLWSKYFKALSTLLPDLATIRFHSVNYTLLLHVIKAPKALRKAVYVEHDKVGQQSDYDDNIDKYVC